MKKSLTVAIATLSTACATQTAQVGPLEPADPVPSWSQMRTNALEQLAINFERVHFTVDTYRITPRTRRALAENVSIMSDFPEIRIEVQGHCDERGSTEYNLALGERRAQVIKRYMVTAGIEAHRIGTISFGEERPLEQAGHEYAYAQNRRAEFRLMIGDHPWVGGSIPEPDMTVAGLRP